jgi:predicted phosphodiesterase
VIAFLSDMHGHLTALETVLADARRRGARRFVCLGDVGSSACLDVLAAAGAECVFGNWEVSGWQQLAESHRPMPHPIGRMKRIRWRPRRCIASSMVCTG